MNEQLLLFDLAPYSIQRSAAEDEALSGKGVWRFTQIEYKQLELDLFAQLPNEAPLETLSLAA
jgi:hypothetical protein